jgi:hypothetical protein
MICAISTLAGGGLKKRGLVLARFDSFDMSSHMQVNSESEVA